MTEYNGPAAQAPSGPPPGRSGLPPWFLIAIVGVLVLGVAVTAIVLAVTLGGDDDGDGDDSAGGSGQAEEPETFDVTGEMALFDFEGNILRYEGICSGYGGYQDMEVGAQVTIRDSKGETLAVGALEEGQPDGRDTCVFPFTVTDVPAGQTIYSVEVSHRGEISFTEEDADALLLTLGG